MMELDQIDQKAATAFEGYLVRKDLVHTFSRQFPVPTYVVEFLLGRYCASIDPQEIEEGLEIVQRQLKDRTIKAGEEELFKSRAREAGEVKIIDLITARLDARSDCYLATIPSLRINDARIEVATILERDGRVVGMGGPGLPTNGAATVEESRKVTAAALSELGYGGNK